DGDDCLICDATGAPVGIGGIMGGASSEIGPHTTTVLVEAAFFTPMVIARTAKRLGLRTEASARFERGCDPAGIERAVARLCAVAGTGQVSGDTVDVSHGPSPAGPIRVRTARVNAVLGTALDDEAVRGYLAPIGFRATAVGPGLSDVVPPSFRPDATAEIDVVEEVARHHSYSSIERTRRASPHVGRLTPFQRARRELRQVLVGLGISEAVCPPLVGPGDHERAGRVDLELIHAVEPLAREESVLRASLRPGLLRALAFNAAHGHPRLSLFEIGHVFRVPAGERGPLPEETDVLAVVLPEGAPAAKAALDVVLEAFHRDDVGLAAAELPGLHPGRTARLEAGGAVIGQVGEVDHDVTSAHGLAGRIGILEIEVAALLPDRQDYGQARPVSRFPSGNIDLALVVDDVVPADAVAATLRREAGELLVELALFDVFRDERLGAGRRSLAFALRFQAQERTLTDADVAQLREHCISAVAAAHGARLRG
ncbi:MAG: phenylalanine--tRNA ligase subunit beta, partial [Acidimicrobiales bacterium]